MSKLALIAGGDSSIKPVNITLEQDDNDVNIRVNGEFIAYFSVENEKISLNLVTVSRSGIFNTTTDGRIKVND